MIPAMLAAIAVVSYLLGSLNGAVIASKYVFHRDVREYGSGNAGLTNFYRTFGTPGLLTVLGTDVVKSLIAVLIGGAVMGIVEYPTVGKLFAGFCLMLGHIYPVFYGFRGGKGVVCAAVTLLCVDIRLGLLALVIFAVIVAFTRYVSLGSICAALVAPLGVWAEFGGLCGWLCLFCTLLLVIKHRSNIRRLLTKTRVLSSDVSAGFDPDYPDVMDKNNCAYLGRGPVFNKYTGSRGKSGSNDANAEYIAFLRKLMEENNIIYQTSELGKVDAGGGGTIAYILANLGMEVIDFGVAVLNMHAPWEITSKADIYEAYNAYRAFLK